MYQYPGNLCPIRPFLSLLPNLRYVYIKKCIKLITGCVFVSAQKIVGVKFQSQRQERDEKGIKLDIQKIICLLVT